MPDPILDPREARPLTSREISKILSSIIGGVVTADPHARERVPVVLELARTKTSELVRPTSPASWELAIGATVAGLRGWCDPRDVDIALRWVDANLHKILSGLATRLPS